MENRAISAIDEIEAIYKNCIDQNIDTMIVSWSLFRVLRDLPEFEYSTKVSLLIKGTFRGLDVMADG